MKKFQLTVSFLLIFMLGFGFEVFAVKNNSATNNTNTIISTSAVAVPDAKTEKAIKKAERKKLKEQKKAERKAKFMLWVAQVTGRVSSSDSDQIVAILLAFFLGFLGIHRVFLKSNPVIILWYILTLGGIFGLIPLIDFIRLIIGDIDHYRGNDSLFACFQS